MKLYKINFLRFIKNYHISIVVLAGLLYFCYKVLHTFSTLFSTNDIFYGLAATQRHYFILFIVFLYASYEYVYGFKTTHIEETVFSNHKGKVKSYLYIFLTLFTPVLFVFVFSVIINFITGIIGNITNPFYYLHILIVCVLNCLLFFIISILFGIILATKFNRIVAYTIMILSLFLMSSVFDMFFQMLSYKTEINFFTFKYFFSKILPQNTSVLPEYQYGISAEIMRWNLTCFWIFALCTILILTVKSKTKRNSIISVCLCVLLAIVNLAGYFLGGSEVLYDNSLKSIATYDAMYYKTSPKLEEKVGFTVDTYDMNLNIWRDLSATVTMKINNPEKLKEYKFMLYRDFKISSVIDENKNNLEWKHNGDYLNIISHEAVSEITITYKGASNIFFSNIQATALPGSFPYYPIAGFQILNDTEVNELKDGTKQVLSNPGYLPISNGFTSQYNIKINTLMPVYSNIEEVQGRKNEFSGKATYPTLMSGLIEKGSGRTYQYYPLIATYENNLLTEEKLNNLQSEIDKYENKTGKQTHLDLTKVTIFNVSAIFEWASYGYATALDDQIFIADCDETDAEKIAEILVEEYNGYVEVK